MIRVAVFLAVVCLIALGVAWIADRPGEVSVVWLGWRIETSLMVLLGRDRCGGRGRHAALVDRRGTFGIRRVMSRPRSAVGAMRTGSTRSCAG